MNYLLSAGLPRNGKLSVLFLLKRPKIGIFALQVQLIALIHVPNLAKFHMNQCNELPLQFFRAGNIDVHLYKICFAGRYIALTAIVKFCIGSPKTARSEQVCVHQKS